MRSSVILGGVAALAPALAPGMASAASPGPRFGPNVVVFTPSMSQASIQSTLDATATQQVLNQFGTQRYATFFAPGTYGSTANPPFFNQGIPIFASQAFQSPPNEPGDQFHDLLTIFLDAVHGSGGINSVINGVGGSSTAANPDTPVDVASYP